jgi:hypothetical protein
MSTIFCNKLALNPIFDFFLSGQKLFNLIIHKILSLTKFILAPELKIYYGQGAYDEYHFSPSPNPVNLYLNRRCFSHNIFH